MVARGLVNRIALLPRSPCHWKPCLTCGRLTRNGFYCLPHQPVSWGLPALTEFARPAEPGAPAEAREPDALEQLHLDRYPPRRAARRPESLTGPFVIAVVIVLVIADHPAPVLAGAALVAAILFLRGRLT
jgi:hypothetical protein